MNEGRPVPVRVGGALLPKQGFVAVDRSRVRLVVADEVVVDARGVDIRFAVAPPSLFIATASDTWRIASMLDEGAAGLAAAGAAVGSGALAAGAAATSTSVGSQLLVDLLTVAGAQQDQSIRPRRAMGLAYVFVGPVVAVTMVLMVVVGLLTAIVGLAWLVGAPDLGLRLVGLGLVGIAVGAGPWGLRALWWGVRQDFGGSADPPRFTRWMEVTTYGGIGCALVGIAARAI